MFNTLAGTSYDANSWADPVPFEAEAPHGLAITGSASALWLSTPSGVWHAALDPTPRDLSADVLWLAMRETPNGGAVTLALRNDDGRYDNVGAPGAAVRAGTELRVSPGYTTASGVEVSAGPAFWVTGWERRYGGGEASLVVHAGDGWALLSGWRARRQFAWARGEAAIASILGFILQRVGLGLQSANPSDAMLTHRPAFTVHPGETGATAVRRLMATVPDLLLFRGREAWLRLPQPTDRAAYAFGSYHPSTPSVSPKSRRTRLACKSSAPPASARHSTGTPCPSSASASDRSTTSTRTLSPRPSPTRPPCSTATAARPSPASSSPRPAAPWNSTTSSTSTRPAPPPPLASASPP